MKRLAFAILIAACTPDVDQYPVQPNTSPPTIAQAHQPPSHGTGVDAGVNDGAVGDGRLDGGLPDGGAFSMDAGGRPSDAGVPP